MTGRISHDLYYIENWSLLLDLKILVLTIVTGFAHKNAY
jgi:lipopolysaccharide/colanic/teichoic acid biosynthesis glycosyltransferase